MNKNQVCKSWADRQANSFACLPLGRPAQNRTHRPHIACEPYADVCRTERRKPHGLLHGTASGGHGSQAAGMKAWPFKLPMESLENASRLDNGLQKRGSWMVDASPAPSRHEDFEPQRPHVATPRPRLDKPFSRESRSRVGMESGSCAETPRLAVPVHKTQGSVGHLQIRSPRTFVCYEPEDRSPITCHSYVFRF